MTQLHLQLALAGPASVLNLSVLSDKPKTWLVHLVEACALGCTACQEGA